MKNLWKKFPIGFYKHAIEVSARCSWAAVSQKNSIRIDHGDDIEVNFFAQFTS